METLYTAHTHFKHCEYEIAAELYHELARDGDERAACCYAYCLLRGIGVDYDPTEAKSFFSFAKEIQGGDACYNLAMMYMHGEGVVRDYSKTISYMRIAAQKGCVEARLYLGMAYTLGCVFEPDVQRICPIPFHKPEYRIAEDMLLAGFVDDAEADEEARYSVIDADQKIAFEYFRSAAHSDPTYTAELVAKGQFLYAKCYIDGLGTDFNRDVGARLMLAAGKSGSPDAIAFLAENGITPEMLLSAGKNKNKNG